MNTLVLGKKKELYNLISAFVFLVLITQMACERLTRSIQVLDGAGA